MSSKTYALTEVVLVTTRFTFELPDGVLPTQDNVRKYAYASGGNVKSSEVEDSTLVNEHGTEIDYAPEMSELRESLVDFTPETWRRRKHWFADFFLKIW